MPSDEQPPMFGNILLPTAMWCHLQQKRAVERMFMPPSLPTHGPRYLSCQDDPGTETLQEDLAELTRILILREHEERSQSDSSLAKKFVEADRSDEDLEDAFSDELEP